MPERVVAVDGASVVSFPWATAAGAVAALTSAAAALGAQAEGRASMLATIDRWSGGMRDDFDEKHAHLAAMAAGLVETLTARAGAIVDAADEANAEQARRNDVADAELVNAPQ